MEADGELLTPLPLSVLRFTGIQNYNYTDQRKGETDIRSLSNPRPLAPNAVHKPTEPRLLLKSDNVNNQK